MSVIATILLLISAFTHAGWNLISKKEHPTHAFFLVANTIGAISIFPILLFFRKQVPLIPTTVWLFVVMSGFFLAAYMATLAGAYRNGDISIVYPIVRSLPVIFVLIATLVLGKGHEISWLLLLGIILVATGCMVLPMKSFGDFRFRNYQNTCCFLALLSAIGVAGYTIVDDEALRRLRELAGMPFKPVEGTLVYLALEGISCSIWQGVFMLFVPGEKKHMIEVIKRSKSAAAFTGIGIYLTYGLVLASMNYVTNVSYVAAFRQLSIVLGAIFGMTLLSEPRYLPKTMGIIAIFFGLIVTGIG